MKFDKVRENAFESWKQNFDSSLYELLNFSNREDYVKNDFLIEFLFAVSPDFYDEFKKGFNQVKKYLLEIYAPKLDLPDFSNVFKDSSTFNMEDIRVSEKK